MAEYIFGVNDKPLTKAEKQRRSKVAQENGAIFVGPLNIPGQGIKSWFAKENKGYPFDQRVETAVLSQIGPN